MLLLSLSTLLACVKPVPVEGLPTPQSDPHAALIAATSLRTAAGLSHVRTLAAADAGSYAECLVFAGLSTALTVGTDALVAASSGGGGEAILPDVNLDFSICLPLAESVPDGVDVGSLDVQVALVLAGIQDVVSLYGNTILEADCEAYYWMTSALLYASNAMQPIFDELRDPDGVVIIPAVYPGLSDCTPEPEED